MAVSITVNDDAPDQIDPFEDFEPVTPYVVPEDTLPTARRRRRVRGPVIAAALALVVVVGTGGFVAGRLTGDSAPPTTAAGGDWASDEDHLLAVALTLHQQGDLRAAEQAYDSLLAMNPNNQYALYNIGVIRQGEGKLDEAVAKYDAAIAIDPEMMAARYNRDRKSTRLNSSHT